MFFYNWSAWTVWSHLKMRDGHILGWSEWLAGRAIDTQAFVMNQTPSQSYSPVSVLCRGFCSVLFCAGLEPGPAPCSSLQGQCLLPHSGAGFGFCGAQKPQTPLVWGLWGCLGSLGLVWVLWGYLGSVGLGLGSVGLSQPPRARRVPPAPGRGRGREAAPQLLGQTCAPGKWNVLAFQTAGREIIPLSPATFHFFSFSFISFSSWGWW